MRYATLLFTSALALLPGIARAEDQLYRALVADHAAGKVTAIDAMTGNAIAHIGVAGPARLKLAPDQRHVTLTQGAQGIVQFVDIGLKVEGHGDHADVSVAGPARLLAGQISGRKPSHINFGGGQVAAFFDGEGLTRFGALDRLATGKGKTAELKTERSHHGLAKPVAKVMAISIPHPTDEKALPSGIAVVDMAGKTLARSTDCADMHGEGMSGGVVAFGCGDGVLFLREKSGTFSFQKVAYPASLPQGQKVRNIEGGSEVKAMFADFGLSTMLVIDPASTAFQQIDLPARRMAFAIDKATGDYGYAITEEGRLHRISVLGAKIETSVQVTDRYSMEGGSTVARPRIAAYGEIVAVTDPAKGLVHFLTAKTLAKLRSVSVPGAPFDVIVTGGSAGDH